MKKNKVYSSMKYKSLRQSIVFMLERDFKLIGSEKVLELLADNVLSLVEKHMPDKMPPGQMMISSISKEAPKGHQRGIKGLLQTPVKLTIVDNNLINRYTNNEKARIIKRDHIINLFKEAYQQGGVLSAVDVALIAKMSPCTVSKYVKEHMEINNEIVPTRGFIHDVGPSISHKGIIVGRFLKGELPSTVAKATNHSQQAVDRYIKDYERVKICIKQKMDLPLIKSATGLSKKLIIKYQELYTAYEGGNNEQAS